MAPASSSDPLFSRVAHAVTSSASRRFRTARSISRLVISDALNSWFGVGMPAIGKPVSGLLCKWRKLRPEILVGIYELADRDLAVALEERRLDLVLIPSFTLWPHAVAIPVYKEEIVAALPEGHGLSVTTAASRRCGRSARSAGACRRACVSTPSGRSARDARRRSKSSGRSAGSWKRGALASSARSGCTKP